MRERAAGVGAVVLAVCIVSGALTPRLPLPREGSTATAHGSAERKERTRRLAAIPGLGAGDLPVAARQRCAARALRVVPSCGAQPASVAGTTHEPMRFRKVLVGTGGDTESSVTVGPKGTLLACSHGGFEVPSPVWSSADDGARWRRADPVPNLVPSGDCDITILANGTWAVVFDTIVSATVATSSDRGKTWTVVYTAAVPAGSVDRPWLVAHGNSLVLAYSNAPGAYQPAIQIVARSSDGGRTWLDQKIVNTTDPPARPHAVLGRPVVHGRTILIPTMMFNALLGGPSWLYLLRSNDGGETWARKLVRGPYQTAFQFPSLTRARNGTLYTTIPVGVGGRDMEVTVLVSGDDGRTWKTFTVARHVTFPGPVTSVWADARPDGTATLAWMTLSEPDSVDPISEILGLYPVQDRQVWAARVGPDGVIVRAQPVSPPVKDPTGYEFFIVDHDAKGRAHIVAPLDTGEICHRPSPTGNRGRECVYDFIER